MKARIAALVALTFLPATAGAQAIGTMHPLYDNVKQNVIKSAEAMPAASYAYKPTPKVRSFGQLVGHLADANYMICATARGEKNPAPNPSYEKVTKKADLVAAVTAAFAYCDGVYKMADADLSSEAEMFGMKMTRLGWAFMNVTHDNLHYGNLITYLRLKGLVPPSSQGPGM